VLSEDNNEYRYVPGLIGNREEFNSLQINLAKDLDDVSVLLLIALYTSAMYPMTVSEEDIHKEITSLLDSEDWDGIAFKGLKWIQELIGD
jgi:hypothetical protein